MGIHPGTVRHFAEDDLQALENLLRNKTEYKICAVGEIGMDNHYTTEYKTPQRDMFKAQMELAFRYDLPAIIHDREAHADCLAVIKELAQAGMLREQPGVFHCYSGSSEFARELSQYGFYFGFDGPVTYKNNRRTLEVVAALPKEVICGNRQSLPHTGPASR